MRTVTRKIESDGKQKELLIPRDWERILSLTVSGLPLSASIPKNKKVIILNEIPDKGKIITAHIVLKDTE